jgi:predicted RecA/RadA family phage recombinase
VSNAIIAPLGATFVHEGVTIPIVTDVEIPAGNVVVVGKLVGVAKFGICANSRGSITVAGVFRLVKDPTTNIPAGTILYWSKISHHVIKNAYAHSMIGISVEDAPPSSLTVAVRLLQ